MDYKIDNCSNSDYMKLSRAITDFNLSNLPANAADDLASLGYVIRDDVKGLVAGITGKLLLGRCLSIDILWVDPAYRNKGYASRLLAFLEENAVKRGSHLVFVDTFDFQALGFYKKHGYKVFGELKDCPYPGNVRYYLSKKL